MGVYISDNNGNLNRYAGGSSLLLPGRNKILNMIYPIGSIYMSVNDVSPQVFLGGTWEKIQDTFLLASGTKHSAGATGGEETHTLTTSEMPAHVHSYQRSNPYTAKHTLTYDEMPEHIHSVYSTNAWSSNAVGLYHDNTTNNYKAYGIAGVDQSSGNEGYTAVSATKDDSGNYNYLISMEGGNKGHDHDITLTDTTTGTTGGYANTENAPHNNMPPYLAVYMWKRTA